MRFIRKFFYRLILLSLVTIFSLVGLIAVTPVPEAIEHTPKGLLVNDVTSMNPVAVDRVVTPKTVAEVQELVRAGTGPISVGGGHFSMGGQTASEATLHFDMRELKSVVKLDKERQQVTVQAGIIWHDLIEAIDPEDFSIKIMQSYSNFTVGGSLSVNVHGRYIGYGPIVSSVDSIKVVMADGSLVESSRSKNPEIFAGCIGGYGGLGIIVEATLNLEKNVPLQRELSRLKASDYADYFKTNIRDNHDIIFQNGDLIPDNYDEVYSVIWKKTTQDLTEKRRVAVPEEASFLDKALEFIVLDLPYGIKFRRFLEPLRYRNDPIVWRNYEASYDVADLAPIATARWSHVLQEYFIPVENFLAFSHQIRDILNKYQVQVANLSIRHALPDTESTLSWARKEVFAFVLYYKQSTDIVSRRVVGDWTRELVDASIRLGGTYYLPYQPQALLSQFMQAYPEAPKFFALKQQLDPNYRFRNKLWDAYYKPDQQRKIFEETTALKGYFRAEDQSYLTLPEWQLVFASEDLAVITANRPQGEFPFFTAVIEFWKSYARVFKATATIYPINWEYHFMNCLIGVNTTVEYLVKGAYEATIGRFTSWLASDGKRPGLSSIDLYIHRVYQDYAKFIHLEPWYKFPFSKLLSELWSLRKGAEDHFVRYYERKIYFSVELIVKALLSKLFTLGKENLYGAEDLHIGAIVKADAQAIAHFITPDQLVTTIDEGVTRVQVPRYQPFTDLIAKMVSDPEGNRVSFSEISGNKSIVFSAIAPKNWYPSITGAAFISEISIFSQPEVKRVVFAVSTQDLIEVLKSLKGRGVILDHVFDY